jgi:hypothetical protein
MRLQSSTNDITAATWLRATDSGQRFAPKNPQLRHLEVIPVCTDDFGTLGAQSEKSPPWNLIRGW